MDKHNIILSKIKLRDELAPTISILRFKEKKIVFTNGCFDILHKGHIEYLSKARNLGDFMIVGLNTDQSVKKLKGENRPVQDETSRATILAALSFIDLVVLFNEDTPYNLISLIKPDILVKGADYKESEIIGYDVVKKNGGKIITIALTDGYSTSNIIEKLRNGYEITCDS